MSELLGILNCSANHGVREIQTGYLTGFTYNGSSNKTVIPGTTAKVKQMVPFLYLCKLGRDTTPQT